MEQRLPGGGGGGPVGRWALCGLRKSQTATVTKALCVCMDACVHVCVTVSGVTGQGFTRFVTSGQQKNIRQPGSFLRCRW